MLEILEIGCTLLILVTIFTHPAARKWVVQLQRKHQMLAIGLLAVLCLGQVIDQSRSTFPFVRWSMYTELLGDAPLTLAKFKIINSRGEEHWVNPTVLYPSVARNQHERLSEIVTRLERGELSSSVETIFDAYMQSLAIRTQKNTDDDSPITICAVLQSVSVESGQLNVDNRVVRSLHIMGGEISSLVGAN